MGLRDDSVIVVSGGGRGITAQCVIELAKHYHSKFILLGRSSIAGAEPAFAAGITDEMALRKAIITDTMQRGEKPVPAQVQRQMKTIFARREINATLDAIRAAGGDAEYISADITDSAILQKALTDASSRMGNITGILHGAGNLSDKLIENKTIDDFEYVFGAKVHGLDNLLAIIPPEQLEQLILFSSAAGFYGNPGQADYAIANEILNKVAHYIAQNYPRCQVVSINWGPWDAGMVTDELKKLFEERNIKVIPIDVGTRVLVDQLEKSSPDVQLLVGDPMQSPAALPEGDLRTYSVQRQLSESASPFLRAHMVGEHAVLPMLHALAWLASGCEDLYPGYHFAQSDGYRVYKGIVFDGDDTQPYILDVQELKRETDQIVLKATISSDNNGRKRFHYGAEITLEPQPRTAPPFTNFDLSDNHIGDGTTYYRNGTLFHGSALQGIQQVLNLDENRLTTRCILPDISLQTQGQFYVQAFNPYMADIALQSMLIYVRHYRDAASLPLEIKEVEQFRLMPAGMVFYSTMLKTSFTDTELVAEFYIHDEQGNLYLRSAGTTVTISKQMNDLFLQSSKRNNP